MLDSGNTGALTGVIHCHPSIHPSINIHWMGIHTHSHSHLGAIWCIQSNYSHGSVRWEETGEARETPTDMERTCVETTHRG